MDTREPVLNPVRIRKAWRPTQMTLGIREVNEKRREWRGTRRRKRRRGTWASRMIPVVLGPKGSVPYLIDNHHLARALEEEGVKDVLVNVVADLEQRWPGEEFWVFFLDNRAWCHPYDFLAAADATSTPYIRPPVAEMEDDPCHRSLLWRASSGGWVREGRLAPFSRKSSGPASLGGGSSARRSGGRTSVRRSSVPSRFAKADAANYLPGCVAGLAETEQRELRSLPPVWQMIFDFEPFCPDHSFGLIEASTASSHSHSSRPTRCSPVHVTSRPSPRALASVGYIASRRRVATAVMMAALVCRKPVLVEGQAGRRQG